MEESTGDEENCSAKATSRTGGSNVEEMDVDENGTGKSVQSKHTYESCSKDDELYGEFTMEENKRGHGGTADRDE